jgi:hypothetical protein
MKHRRLQTQRKSLNLTFCGKEQSPISKTRHSNPNSTHNMQAAATSLRGETPMEVSDTLGDPTYRVIEDLQSAGM